MRSELTIHLRASRVLTPIVGLCVFSMSAWAQINLVHVTTCGPKAFPSTCTIPSTGRGNVLVAAWASSNGGGGTTITGVSDNVGNVYTEAGNARATDTAANTMTDVWFAKNSASGATVITVTPSPSGATGAATIWEFSGVDPNSPLDQTSILNSQAASSAPTGASVITSSPAEAIVAVANVQGSATGMNSGNSFSSDSTVNGDGWAHFIPASSGTYTPQWSASTSGTFSASTVSFKAASGAGGACDLNQDGAVNVVDVQLAVNMYLGVLSCPGTLDGGTCGSPLVQQILSAALGEGCGASMNHLVSLNWTASASANIAGYNVYRGTTSGGPYTKVSGALSPTTSYGDSTVTAGQTYYYVATAVDTSNNESSYSAQAQATVPSP
jgi:hypothetical protein